MVFRSRDHALGENQVNEQDLRDCFAMFAMMGIIVHEGVLDDRMPHKAYLMADLMLEARNKTPEQEVGITTVKPRKRTPK
jgi:hypothetical protein